MKTNIHSFLEFKVLNESNFNKTLYHGSPHIFKDFKNQVTFFSDTKQFAEDYSNTKSMDYGMDNDTTIYTTNISCDLFNINDPKDERKIRPLLPNKIKYYYNNFGFDAEEDKDEFILNMKGFYTNIPYDQAVNGEVGDKIEDPSYKHDKFVIFKKDNKYCYTYDLKTYNREYDKLHDSYIRDDIYKEVKEFIKNYIKQRSDKSYISDSDFKAYLHLFLGSKNYYGLDDIDQENIEQFNKLNTELEKNIIKKLIDKKYFKKFNLHTKIEELSDTWRYYENDTVHSAIVKLGYGGYKAKEKKEFTYAIFSPQTDAIITKYEIEGIEYDTWEEWLNYSEYSSEVHKLIKTYDEKEKKDLWYKINRWMIYKFWSEKKSQEDLIEYLLNEL